MKKSQKKFSSAGTSSRRAVEEAIELAKSDKQSTWDDKIRRLSAEDSKGWEEPDEKSDGSQVGGKP